MKEPENKTREAAATPRKDQKKAASSAAVVENRPVAAGTDIEPAATETKPAIESSLVGVGGEAKAAAKRDTIAPTEAAVVAAASPVPPVSRPEPASTATPSGNESKPEPKTSPKSEPKPEIRKVGFFPTFLGGVVAAGLGAAATYWAIPQLPEEWRPGAVEAVSPEAQLDAARQLATEAARAEFAAQADTIVGRASEAGADAARQTLADANAAQPASTAAPAEIPAALTDKIAALETTIAELANRPVADGAAPAMPLAQPQEAGVSKAALDELAARVSAQQAVIDELAARPAVDPATAEQVQTLVKQAEQLQQSTEQATRRAQGVTAAAALKTAIENGAPRDQALAELSAAGASVPVVLTGDVPRLDQLRAEFAPAARDGLRASMDAVAADEGTMGKLGNFLRVQTGARSVEPREGSDPDAILSRANADVEAGDIKGALAEIATLPETGQLAMQVWTARAATWVEANAALADLAASGN
ncbi:COG4223 family protein [Paracoccus aestuariivivens]|uniref:Mitochondrial inner membrane protein n=1 Tax=Paracoccus aestuariivivens TaxID=1820333 RepID=A0A6L6JGH2_9RHOB|nr:hypothetical protein [Paracoccus aestuariivivens]MTH78981.1 hypothetical protein [Paracoccus aestuariivivens]